MKLLELFSGTKSVGKVAERLGYDVTSLDLIFPADINIDILDWDYTIYPTGYFNVIHASPPCTEYSRAKTTGVRKIDYANSIVKKTLEIMDYFQPKYYIIENPQSGLLKEQSFMYGIPYTDVDYCKYGMPYRKEPDYGIMCWTLYQDLYVKKIVIVWMVTDTKQLLKDCQVVQEILGRASLATHNLICMLFLKL